MQKTYLALVRGRPEPSAGLIDYAIPRGEEGERVPAQTEYRVVHQLAHYALVEARPLTGRLHQIRRHFKHLRHPIVYDMQYGRGRFNARCHEDCGIARMASSPETTCAGPKPSSARASGERSSDLALRM